MHIYITFPISIPYMGKEFVIGLVWGDMQSRKWKEAGRSYKNGIKLGFTKVNIRLKGGLNRVLYTTAVDGVYYSIEQ